MRLTLSALATIFFIIFTITACNRGGGSSTETIPDNNPSFNSKYSNVEYLIAVTYNPDTKEHIIKNGVMDRENLPSDPRKSPHPAMDTGFISKSRWLLFQDNLLPLQQAVLIRPHIHDRGLGWGTD